MTVYHIPSEYIEKHFGPLNQSGEASECCINLVDVPGFADVGGEEKDLQIFNLISVFLNKIESIDYIFLVVKSDVQRVNHQVKKVYETIQSLYAMDLSDRLCGIFSFSDYKKIPAITAL